MFKKLRRASRASERIKLRQKESTGSLPLTSTNAALNQDKEISSQKSFLGLPAEVRNAIYEYTALDSTLVIPYKAAKQKPSALPPATSLLLVSKQIRHEYRPLLLSLASIVAKVADYDFRNLVRVLSAMSRSDLMALRANGSQGHHRRLRLRLLLSESDIPTLQERQPLRCWFGWLHAWNPNSNSTSPSIQELVRTLRWQYDVEWVRKGRFKSSSSFSMTHVLLRAHRVLILDAHRAMDGICRNEHYAMLDGLQRYYNDHEDVARRDLRRGLGGIIMS